jgi:heme-degrading monooxygenase HmoA
MKQILIDKFVVPEAAADEFIQRTASNRRFLRTLPGFLLDAAYERIDENGNIVVVTIVEWESEKAFDNARQLVQAEYERIGFRPAEMLSRLGIALERGAYTEMVREV